VDERETLKNYLDLKNGIPSHDTMQRVFAIIQPGELQGMLKEILIQMVEMAGQHLDQYHNYLMLIPAISLLLLLFVV